MTIKYTCPFCDNGKFASFNRELFKKHLLTEHKSEVEKIAKRNSQTLNQTAGELAFIHGKETI